MKYRIIVQTARRERQRPQLWWPADLRTRQEQSLPGRLRWALHLRQISSLNRPMRHD